MDAEAAVAGPAAAAVGAVAPAAVRGIAKPMENVLEKMNNHAAQRIIAEIG